MKGYTINHLDDAGSDAKTHRLGDQDPKTKPDSLETRTPETRKRNGGLLRRVSGCGVLCESDDEGSQREHKGMSECGNGRIE